MQEKEIIAYPSFKQAFLIWLKVALYSFGGPASQIAVMHRLIIEEKKWIGEKRFLHALNYCMFLPGPEAQQLAIYLGWLLHKVRGGVVAGALFVVPGFVSILLLSILYAKFQSTHMVQMIFYGIKPAVIAIVLEALIRIGKKTLKNNASIVIAVCAFIGIFFLNIPFPMIILSAALAGFILSKTNNTFQVATQSKIDEIDLVSNNQHISSHSFLKLAATIGLWLAIWFLPILLVVILFSSRSVFTTEALFFSKTAIITFGGAYAVLSYVAQQAVQHYGWLSAGEMLDGLGMAETTPGPLIQVVQFIGFLAAYRHPAGLDPVVAGILGSIITTWVTFVPSFLWIFAGAPYIERVRKFQGLNAAMAAITAAVVGVILNLSVWFAINTLFKSVEKIHVSIFQFYSPLLQSFNWGALIIMLCAIFLTFRYKTNLFIVLLVGMILGVCFNSLHV